jgi:mono/diheme cytochrome c family protein
MRSVTRLAPLLVLSLALATQGLSEEKSQAPAAPVTKDTTARTPQAFQPNPQHGLRLYQRHCQFCHQSMGEGLGVVFPPLARSEWVQGDPSLAIKVLLKGMFGKVKVKGAIYIGAMPPLEEQLNDQQIAEVLSYVRRSWGNKETTVTPSMVARVRKENTAQTEMWESEKLRKLAE